MSAPVKAVAHGEVRMLIDGALVEATGGARFDNVDPATEEWLGEVADASPADVDAAITAARRAFDTTAWATDRQLRVRCLRQLQEALESEREQLRAELVAEAGSPLLATYGPQLDAPLAEALSYPAGLVAGFEWERRLPDQSGKRGTSERWVTKESIGVVAAIVPWNFPIEVTLNKLGPILATGNTVVLKPAPDTPWNATRLGRLVAARTDIPDGVVNVVTTSDNSVAEQLLVDPRVDMVSFTGSTDVGRHIVERSAATMKRTFLELGGKSAMAVLDDADLSTVARQAAGMCIHAGQGCALMTRLLLPRHLYDQGVDAVTAAFAAVPVGDPNDAATVAGPLVSARQRERVEGLIEVGRTEGARVTVCGGRPAHLERGYFVEPTVFADVDPTMRIAREEIFGPVLVVLPHDGDDDAVRIANDSDYGLSGGVFSADRERALRVARRMRTGTVGVNGGSWYGADAPIGGYGASGLGRQNGLEGFEQHLQTKSIGILI
jgi:aldehyde dehydrogenase (NAD+)